MTDSYLTVQDLHARGWSLGMIRVVLGTYDHERWTNKFGQRMPKSIKLYLDTRVLEAETTYVFLSAKERAQAHSLQMRKASQNRQARDAKSLAEYEALPLPIVQVHPIQAGSAVHRRELWQLHLQEFYLWQREHDHLLSGLSQAARREARYQSLQRYRTVVYGAYGLMGDAENSPSPRLSKSQD